MMERDNESQGMQIHGANTHASTLEFVICAFAISTKQQWRYGFHVRKNIAKKIFFTNCDRKIV